MRKWTVILVGLVFFGCVQDNSYDLEETTIVQENTSEQFLVSFIVENLDRLRIDDETVFKLIKRNGALSAKELDYLSRSLRYDDFRSFNSAMQNKLRIIRNVIEKGFEIEEYLGHDKIPSLKNASRNYDDPTNECLLEFIYCELEAQEAFNQDVYNCTSDFFETGNNSAFESCLLTAELYLAMDLYYCDYDWEVCFYDHDWDDDHDDPWDDDPWDDDDPWEDPFEEPGLY